MITIEVATEHGPDLLRALERVQDLLTDVASRPTVASQHHAVITRQIAVVSSVRGQIARALPAPRPTTAGHRAHAP